MSHNIPHIKVYTNDGAYYSIASHEWDRATAAFMSDPRARFFICEGTFGSEMVIDFESIVGMTNCTVETIEREMQYERARDIAGDGD